MTAQRSELVAFFTDYESTTAPLDGPAMRLTVTADLAFVCIGRLTEGVSGQTFKADDAYSIGVDVELLYQTLGAMLRRSDRYAHDRLVDGDLPADHPSLVPVDRAVSVPATRVRA